MVLVVSHPGPVLDEIAHPSGGAHSQPTTLSSMAMPMTSAPRPAAKKMGLVFAAAGVIVVFAVGGQQILQYLGISLPALQGAGGLMATNVAAVVSATSVAFRPGASRSGIPDPMAGCGVSESAVAESAADFTINPSGTRNVPFWDDSSSKPGHRITVSIMRILSGNR